MRPVDIIDASVKSFADPGDGLGHLEDPIQIHLPFARQAAQEVQFDALVVLPEGRAAAFVEILVLDLLAEQAVDHGTDEREEWNQPDIFEHHRLLL